MDDAPTNGAMPDQAVKAAPPAAAAAPVPADPTASASAAAAAKQKQTAREPEIQPEQPAATEQSPEGGQAAASGAAAAALDGNGAVTLSSALNDLVDDIYGELFP